MRLFDCDTCSRHKTHKLSSWKAATIADGDRSSKVYLVGFAPRDTVDHSSDSFSFLLLFLHLAPFSSLEFSTVPATGEEPLFPAADPAAPTTGDSTDGVVIGAEATTPLLDAGADETTPATLLDAGAGAT